MEQVSNVKKLNDVISEVSVGMAIFKGPDLILECANKSFLEMLGLKADALGMAATSIFHEVHNQFTQLLESVHSSGSNRTQRYSIDSQITNNQSVGTSFNITYSPMVHNEAVTGVMVIVAPQADEELNKEIELPNELELLQDIVDNSPMPVGVYLGKEKTIALTNKAILKAWGKDASVIGKTFDEALPELANQPFSKILDEVYATGIAYHTDCDRVDLVVDGRLQTFYYNFTYTPLKKDGKVYAILNTATNITEQIVAQNSLKESEHNFKDLIIQAPVGMCILRGTDMVVEMANATYLQLIDRSEEEFVGKPLGDTLAEVKNQGFDKLLLSVFNSGVSYQSKEEEVRLKHQGVLKTIFLNYTYQPLRDASGNITGILVVTNDITDLVQARKDVQASEERLRMAMDATKLGTWDYDVASNHLMMTPLIRELHGYAEHEQPSMEKSIAAIDPNDRVAYSEALETLKDPSSNGIFNLEYRLINPSTQKRHTVHAKGQVYYNEEGQPQRFIGTMQDITDEALIREEQRKLLTLVENSSDLMSILGMDGKNTYLNKAGREMLGFESEQQVLETPISELHAPEHFQLVNTEVLPSIMEQGQWRGQMLVRHLHTGEIFPVYNSSIRIDDPYTGQPVAIGAVMRDMRPEVDLQEALTQSETLLRSITSAAPTALWMCQANGDMTYFNQTWLDWCGKSLSDNLNDRWLDNVPEDDREDIRQLFANCINNKDWFEFECRFQFQEDTPCWCIVTGQPQYNKKNELTGFIGACTDITEIKFLQQQKDDFIGIASHELKTPVTSIKAYTQVLEAMFQMEGNPDKTDMVRRMDSQVNKLNSLISDLLDVTKINSGRLQFNDGWFNFNEMLDDVINDLQGITRTHTIIKNFEDTGKVYADKERLGQVVTNLITNAIKYSPRADKIVVASCINKNEEVQVSVEDFGIGISEDKLNKVFEQFYRVSGDKQHTFPGLGLGLYISSEIIQREGGRIWVESIENKGSIFYFSVPINKQ